MRHLWPSAARCEATARSAGRCGVADRAVLLGYVDHVEELDTEAGGDLTELLEDGRISSWISAMRWSRGALAST